MCQNICQINAPVLSEQADYESFYRAHGHMNIVSILAKRYEFSFNEFAWKMAIRFDLDCPNYMVRAIKIFWSFSAVLFPFSQKISM